MVGKIFNLDEGDKRKGRENDRALPHRCNSHSPPAFHVLAVWWDTVEGLSFCRNEHAPGGVVSTSPHCTPPPKSGLRVLLSRMRKAYESSRRGRSAMPVLLILGPD